MVQELSAADAASVSAVGYIHLYHKELDNISLGPQALLGVGEPGTGKDVGSLARLPARRVSFNHFVMEVVGGLGGKSFLLFISAARATGLLGFACKLRADWRLHHNLLFRSISP